jgi:hypothetical protein
MDIAAGLRVLTCPRYPFCLRSLGYVDVPMPPRPPALEEFGEGASKQAAGLPITQGWFPLVADEEHMTELQPLLAKLGRTESKTPLGELNVRVSWGTGVMNPELNHRPPLRRRLARLTVIIHGAEGLPPKCADRPTVVAQLEHQTGVTPPAMDTTSPEWPREAATFVFAVTEVTSDLVLSVQDADPVMGAQQVGPPRAERAVCATHLLRYCTAGGRCHHSCAQHRERRCAGAAVGDHPAWPRTRRSAAASDAQASRSSRPPALLCGPGG